MPPLRRSLPWIVLLGLALRLALLGGSLAGHPEMLRPPRAAAEPADGRLHVVGYEASNVAEALVCRDRGFADPFGAATGPTAWMSPGVVAPYAAAFALFGCFSASSVLFLFAVALALSSLMVVLAAAAARRLSRGDERTALVAALLAAVSPFDLSVYVGASLLDLNLHAFLLLLLLHLLLGLRREAAPRRLAVFAAAAALASLFNPGFAALAAGGLAVALWGAPRRLAAAWGLLLAAGVVIAGPWVLYQRQALGVWVPVKSNFAFELSLGNRPEVAGVLDEKAFDDHHPSQNDGALTRYRRLGEVEYLRRHARRFRREVTAGDFGRWTLRRARHYFFGPVTQAATTGRARVERFGYALIGVVLVLYPLPRRYRLRREEILVYAAVLLYATPHLVAAVMERYVQPVAPAALLLAAHGAVDAAVRPGRRQRPTPRAGRGCAPAASQPVE
jgi:hypothetical protein